VKPRSLWRYTDQLGRYTSSALLHEQWLGYIDLILMPYQQWLGLTAHQQWLGHIDSILMPHVAHQQWLDLSKFFLDFSLFVLLWD